MSEFKIEKNVPIPGDRAKYPFADMEVGDSFVVHPDNAGNVNSSSMAYTKKCPGVKFRMRKQTETESRIWRVS